MEHQTFGRRTGLRVSAYALGTGNFGTQWGTKATPAEAAKIFSRFAEAGGTFVDTADSYQNGESEAIVGDLLAADRDHFTLATKFSSASGAHRGVLDTGNSRQNMVRAVEASLRRLKTDRIDLYWVHHPDTVTPIEEILRGLDDLVSAGKILYAGFSNFPAWRAWLLHRQAHSTTALIPVVGPRTVEQLDDYLAALDVSLSPDQAYRLDRVSAVALGVPHEVAAAGRAGLLGGDADRFRAPAVPVA